MNKLDQYIQAATRENTRQSYESAVRHYEIEWQGFLPATADNIAQYLAHYAEQLSVNTLHQRLAALAQWHNEQGFPDPTKATIVRKVIKGIKTLHPAQEKKAKPFRIEQLQQLLEYFDSSIKQSQQSGNLSDELRHTRNKAIFLIGFWRGFRGDELSRLQIENVEVHPNQGMICYLPRTKGDRQLKGSSFKVPALPHLCPVQAYINWINLSGLTEGPVFRGINRWGKISNTSLHVDSLILLLRGVLLDAGINSPELYSTHSLRRGFANWASSNGWDLKNLMDYVGWKNINSAMAYLDSSFNFSPNQFPSLWQDQLNPTRE